ncbi:MAG: hypothetical protein ACKVJU_05530 [Verrucomicrobiales bacterium]
MVHEFSGADDVEIILNALKAKEFKLRSMVLEIAGSNPFLTK